MISVGIIGGPLAELAKLIIDTLYAAQDISAEAVGDTCPPKRYNVLVINDSRHRKTAQRHIRLLEHGDILLINSDDKYIYPLLSGLSTGFITYGFNSKACVTASSVRDSADKTVQICIQRSFLNYYGENILQQEFSISLDGLPDNIYCVLAAVTAGLYTGHA